MDDLFKPEEKKGINPLFIVGAIVGLIAIGVGIWLLSFKPSIEDQTAKILQGSFHDGSPEYAELNKDVIISTDFDHTVESPTGMGTVSIYIRGTVKNRGTRSIDILEVNVAVVTQQKEVLREKKVLVVPVQQSLLAPGETIPITLALEGFDRHDDRADIRWKVTAIRAQ